MPPKLRLEVAMVSELRRGGRARVGGLHQLRPDQVLRGGVIGAGGARWFRLAASGPLPAVAVMVEDLPNGCLVALVQGGCRGAAVYVQVVWQPCRLGGRRPWLLCPVASCRRRCGSLYLGAGGIACRRCLGLAYASQQRHRQKPGAAHPVQAISAEEQPL